MTALSRWAEVSRSHQDVQVSGVGHARWPFQAEEFGFGPGAFQPDLHSRCGDVETAGSLLELERLSGPVEGWPREGRLEHDLDSGRLGWRKWPGRRGASCRSAGADQMSASFVVLVALKEYLLTGVEAGAKYTNGN
jgi:hypothetical protein